jgi:hypothetical protein
VNGVQLKTGHRFRSVHDFGYVSLDILYAYPEDSGTYMCKATNDVGEAVNTCTIQVSSKALYYIHSLMLTKQSTRCPRHVLYCTTRILFLFCCLLLRGRRQVSNRPHELHLSQGRPSL